MPFKLVRLPSGSTFRGPNGARVRVAIRSEQPARTVRITYAGDQDGIAPFEFTIKPGDNQLLIVAVGVAGKTQKMDLVEIADSNERKLTHFFWSPRNTSKSVIIRGT